MLLKAAWGDLKLFLLWRLFLFLLRLDLLNVTVDCWYSPVLCLDFEVVLALQLIAGSQIILLLGVYGGIRPQRQVVAVNEPLMSQSVRHLLRFGNANAVELLMLQRVLASQRRYQLLHQRVGLAGALVTQRIVNLERRVLLLVILKRSLWSLHIETLPDVFCAQFLPLHCCILLVNFAVWRDHWTEQM